MFIAHGVCSSIRHFRGHLLLTAGLSRPSPYLGSHSPACHPQSSPVTTPGCLGQHHRCPSGRRMQERDENILRNFILVPGDTSFQPHFHLTQDIPPVSSYSLLLTPRNVLGPSSQPCSLSSSLQLFSVLWGLQDHQGQAWVGGEGGEGGMRQQIIHTDLSRPGFFSSPASPPHPDALGLAFGAGSATLPLCSLPVIPAWSSISPICFHHNIFPPFASTKSTREISI